VFATGTSIETNLAIRIGLAARCLLQVLGQLARHWGGDLRAALAF